MLIKSNNSRDNFINLGGAPDPLHAPPPPKKVVPHGAASQYEN